VAVEAMRRGASDFIQKPWENEQLLGKLKYQIQKRRAQSRLDREYEFELQEARDIQRKLFPTSIPQAPGYEIAGSSYPVRFVGGDYFDVAEIAPGRTAICIADVVGKGLPAALLLSSLHAALAPLMAEGVPPRDLCRRLNRILCGITPLGKFISFFYGVLDARQNKLVYCNAGHNPPALIRSARWQRLSVGGTVQGLFGDSDYEQQEVQLRLGDALVLYTDGLTEARNNSEAEFGEEQLVNLAIASPGMPATELQSTIMHAAAAHCGGYFQDDATLIVVRATE
jgi:sigma-B regulation protein RsbU (phosphoserine phosphatase)